MDLNCPNCGDNLGKASQLPAFVGCGECGHQDIFNSEADPDDMDDEEKSRWKKKRNKLRGY